MGGGRVAGKKMGGKKVLLVCDIGNTNITLGVYDGEETVFTARIVTEKNKTEDQYAVEINGIFLFNGCQDIDSAIISSVVPSAQSAICKAVERLFGIEPLVLGPGIKTGLNIKIDNPAQLGADLVAGAVGAISKYPTPCIVIDMGTATTISVINEDKSFVGGAIMAGVNLMLESLYSKTAQLPQIDIGTPQSVIGTNTVDSMKSGVVFGTAAMLDGMIERIQSKLCKKAAIVATGGLACNIVKHCKNEIIYDRKLLLDGLKIIYEKNSDASK